MTILVDTNVLISALVYGGKPLRLLVKLVEAGHTLCITSYIDSEFHDIVELKWPQKMRDIFQKYRPVR